MSTVYRASQRAGWDDELNVPDDEAITALIVEAVTTGGRIEVFRKTVTWAVVVRPGVKWTINTARVYETSFAAMFEL